MLALLDWIEEDLPDLLFLQREAWKDVYVDYHAPFVERLWRPWKHYRIYLHRILPCASNEALFHPHPWPSAMKVVSGSYEMAIGYGSGMRAPPHAAKVILPKGSIYEMTEPDAWHYVRPIGGPSLSIMVTGEPWNRETHKSPTPLSPLSFERREALFRDFFSHYPH